MVRHGLKHIFQKPTPDIDSSDRTQQLRAKTIYAGTVDLAKTLISGNNRVYQTYNGPYEVVTQAGTGDSKLIASRTYDDMLSITKGKVLLNQLPFNSLTQDYYQKNFAKGQMYEGNYNRFDPSFNFTGHTGCNNSVLVYDISSTGFTGRASYDTNGGFIGATGPIGDSENNKHIFVDPNHCYYSNPCLLDASYTRFVNPALSGLTGPAQFNAQQIISADQYRGFSFPMPDFNLICEQPNLNQSVGPLFCPPTIPTLSNFSVPSKNYGLAPFQIISPESNSMGAFTYSSSNTSVATIVGDTINIAGAGSSQITALQAASIIYASGSITTTFTVNPISPTLSNFNIPSKIVGDSLFQIIPPDSNSTGAFTYSSSNLNVATIVNDTITIVGVGSSQITAFQAATTNFTSGTIPTTFTVNTPSIVAVGSGSNTIIYSSDGMNWFPSTNGSTIFDNGKGVAWNGTDRWVAVGNQLNSIATSTDGISWISSGKGGLSTGGEGVAYNGSLWVAVGTATNTITTSTDGISWTGRGNSVIDSAGQGVAWNGSLWVAVGTGTNTIATSTNGSVWTGLGALIFTDDTLEEGGRSVAWSSSLSLWVAVGVGTANTIATSTDGSVWTGRGTSIFTNGGHGVAWNGTNRWVAVGDGTNTIATSTDGISWTGLGALIFTTAGYGVVWNSSLSKWIAVGKGTNSIATSTDGFNWVPSINGNSFFTLGSGVASK